MACKPLMYAVSVNHEMKKVSLSLDLSKDNADEDFDTRDNVESGFNRSVKGLSFDEAAAIVESYLNDENGNGYTLDDSTGEMGDEGGDFLPQLTKSGNHLGR